MALARGRNPWIWGGGALILGIPWPGIDLPILGVVPVIFLMFFAKPSPRPTTFGSNACSKCASPHPPAQNFCTKCGWDLSKEYSPEGTDTILASEINQPAPSSTATLERPSEQEEPEAASQPSAPVSEPSAEENRNQDGQDGTEETTEEAATGVTPERDDSPAPEGVEPAQRPWGIPQPGPAPTAEGMTARGAALLSEGKLQEAIDQFTKAIALDPKHREAFERRAEAYAKQGRGERAEEDYRSVRALSAGS